MKSGDRTYRGKDPGVNFAFECWRCWADCVVYGKPAGFWTAQYRVVDEWDCWNCGATNITPDPPWTEAD